MRARCMAYAVRLYFPEVLMGAYTDLEIVDAMGKNVQVDMNEEGEVVIVE